MCGQSDSLAKELTSVVQAEKAARQPLTTSLLDRMDGVGKSGLDGVEFMFKRS